MAASVDLVKYARPGYMTSTQLRGATRTSPGNVVKPTGTETGAGAIPDAWAAATNRPVSQYHRAAEAPVPVIQYSVMLSRMLSRVRLPAASPSKNARDTLRTVGDEFPGGPARRLDAPAQVSICSSEMCRCGTAGRRSRCRRWCS